MKIFNTIILLICISASTSYSQLLQQATGGTSEDVCLAVDIKVGREIYAGYTESMGAGGKDVLVKRQGFFKTFGTTGDDMAKSVAAVTAASGIGQDYVLAGSTSSGGSSGDILVIKTDVTGTLLWSKTFGGPGLDAASKVIEVITPGVDTTYYITGTTSSYGAGGLDAFLLGLSPGGNVKTFRVYGTPGNDIATSIVAVNTPAGLAIGGYSDGYSATSDVFLYITGTDGTLINAASFDSGRNDYAYDIASFSTSGIQQVYFTGSTESPALDKDVLNFSVQLNAMPSSNTIAWAKRFGNAFNDEGYGIVVNSSSGPRIAGYTEKTAGDKDGFAVLIDFGGQPEASKMFGGCQEDILYDISAENTSLYLSAGSTANNSSGMKDWYFSNTDINSASSCNQNDFNPAANAVTLTLTGRTPATSQNSPVITDAAISLVSGNAVYTVNDICSTCNLTFNVGPSDPLKTDTIICNSPTYTTDASVNIPCATYLWVKDGVAYATTAAITVSEPGLYKVTVSNGSCTKKDSVNVIFPGIVNTQLFSKWYFGQQAGLDFSSASPSLITGSLIDATAGTTSISDIYGNLLFYSNGVNVWNKNNDLMLNGTGMKGDPNYSQSVITVPDPNDRNKYFIFTNGSGGIYYSIIDMSKNGGLGEVTSKDNFLFSPSTEKLAAVADNSGNVWVVSSVAGSNEFRMYKLIAGANPTFGGLTRTQFAGVTQSASKGTMRFSNDGSRVAISFSPLNEVDIYDFDKTTGALSATPIATLNVNLAYDAEFSPDNTKLYTVSQNGGELLQFDLNAGNSAAINASKVVLSNVSSTYYNSIKLGGDGKIYVGLGKIANGFLGVINAPNASGTASDYQHKLITMESGTSAQNGLPNTVANLSSKPDFTYQDTCYSNTTRFFGLAEGNPSGWNWDFGDGATATGATPTHVFPTPNTSYPVRFSYTNVCGVNVTISKNVFIAPIPDVKLKDTVICETPYIIDPGNAGTGYLWSTGETTQSISVSNAGKYWVKVTKNGCSNADTMKLGVWGQGNKGDYNWVFGNGTGIKHSTSGQPSVFPVNPMNATGGSSSISDPLGNLLFYTDGINVYNKSNAVMEGGTGLKGDAGSTQSALIIPDPRAQNLYYVFTTSATNGFNYSLIDLSYNNGLGKVTRLNVPLFTPATEKLSGVKDDNGDFWVAGHKSGSNEFVAYKISTAKGFENTPVVSPSGIVHTSNDGYLKFSSDGSKAAVAIKGQNTVEVFDFDKSTGLFSNPVTITNITSPYGVEFSKDNSRLYASTDGDGHLYEYTLGSGNAAAVMATQKEISSDPAQTYESLQIGPDGRIYIAHGNGSTFVSVINNPGDSLDVAYQNKAINLGTASNGILPNLLANYFNFSDWGIFYADTCSGMTTRFLGSAPDSVRTWTWNFGDGATATGQQVSHKYSGPGTYNVVLKADYYCGQKIQNKSLTINPTPVLNLKDTTVCTASSITLDAANPLANHLWSDNTTGQTLLVNSNGKYSVIVEQAGCAAADSATVTFVNAGNFDFGKDTTLCNGASMTLNPGTFPAGATFNWTNKPNPATISSAATYTVTGSGNYKLVVTIATCTVKDSIQVNYVTPPAVNLGPDFSLCQGTSRKIGSNNPGAAYRWSTGATGDTITVSNAGKYWMEVNKGGGCIVSDTVLVTTVAPITVDLGADKTVCAGDPQTLDAGNPGASYAWTSGGTAAGNSQQLPVSSSGTYRVIITKGPCTATDDVTLTFITPPAAISLGIDRNVCAGTLQTLDAGSHPGFSFLWSNNATAQAIQPETTGEYWVHIYRGECVKGDTIRISFQNGPELHLPQEIIFCSQNGDTVQLQAGTATSYLWKPQGQTTPSITVSLPGFYTLEAKDALGCSTTISTELLEICEAQIYIPNIFSPNGDGRNDEFKISSSNVKAFELLIFNQWGELIFTSGDLSVSWDGKYKGQVVPEGAYVWKVTYSGETVNGIKSYIKTGDVTVIK